MLNMIFLSQPKRKKAKEKKKRSSLFSIGLHRLCSASKDKTESEKG